MIEKMIYEWRIKAVHEVISTNFVQLRNIQNQNIIWILEFLDSLSNDDKFSFLSACVRQSISEEVRHKIDINDLDKYNRCQTLNNINQQNTYLYYLKTLSLTSSGQSKDITPKMIKQAYGINEPLVRFKKLRSIVTKLLTNVLGKPFTKDQDYFNFVTPINNFYLETLFSNGGGMQINMHQKFSYIYNDQQFIIHPNILNKLGLINLGWDRLQESDLDVFKQTLLSLTISVLEDLSENFK